MPKYALVFNKRKRYLQASHHLIKILPFDHTRRFTVKTTDEHNKKVFINICSSVRIPFPAGFLTPDEQLPQEIVAYLTTTNHTPELKQKAEEMLRIPMILSDARMDIDHKEEPCTGMHSYLHIIILYFIPAPILE